MADDTRDIAIEARTDIRAIRKMLEGHIEETREHRDQITVQLTSHNNLIQQIKGARIAITAIISAFVALGLGTIAKLFGVIR